MASAGRSRHAGLRRADGPRRPVDVHGAVVGSNLQRRLPRLFRDADRRTLLVAGAAAGVSAIFKAPTTGSVFALEVPYQDDLARYMLLPTLVSQRHGLPGLRRHQRDLRHCSRSRGPST